MARRYHSIRLLPHITGKKARRLATLAIVIRRTANRTVSALQSVDRLSSSRPTCRAMTVQKMKSRCFRPATIIRHILALLLVVALLAIQETRKSSNLLVSASTLKLMRSSKLTANCTTMLATFLPFSSRQQTRISLHQQQTNHRSVRIIFLDSSWDLMLACRNTNGTVEAYVNNLFTQIHCSMYL